MDIIIILKNVDVCELQVRLLFRTMALGKVSGCVLMAVCLLAMGDALNYDNVAMSNTHDSPGESTKSHEVHDVTVSE